MGVVKEVVLDESALIEEDDDGNHRLLPSSAAFLRLLRYSNLRAGICYQYDATSKKATFVKEIAAAHSLASIPLCGTHEEASKNFIETWNGVGSASLFITSRNIERFFLELKNVDWRIVCIGGAGVIATTGEFISINKLEELPITMCRLNKMALDGDSVLIIGYVMKPSREEDFAKRGAFPMLPTHNGLMFAPLSFELPLAPQMKQIDAVLHKATDEIVGIGGGLDFSTKIIFSKGMNELKRLIENTPNFCLIDPLYNIYPLLDRQKIQAILCKLDEFNIKGRFKLRAPHFLKVENFDSNSLKDQLYEAKLSFPVIVKPQIACGVADAHNMALVFKFEDFENANVPLPAVIQEYIDHGSILFKFYVLGSRVFHAVKKSMPNADHLLSLSEKSGSSSISFNSLKSLPLAREDQFLAKCAEFDGCLVDLELVNHAAEWLRKYLGLTIFGFDIVIQEGSRDHVIVDLNYLPSFKEIPDCDAIPAFWDAIQSSYKHWTAAKAQILQSH